MSLRRGDVLMITGLLSALGLSALTAPRLARLLPREDPEPEAAPVRAAPAKGPPTPDAAKKISVKLYFEKQEESALAPEDREIAYAPDLSQQIRILVLELISGSAAGHLAPLPPETRVHGVFVSARGTAYVDLSKEAVAAGSPTGSLGERLSVYALVDSITANFPAIRRVQILIDDRPATSLAGHIDLSRPLPPDMTLVAVEAPPLSPEPDEAPALPPPASPSPPSPQPGAVAPGVARESIP